MKKAIFVILILFFFIGNVNAQQSKMAVGGQVGISLPMGDFSDGANMGFGFLGNFLYSVAPNIDITGTTGYLTWGGDVEGSDADLSFSDIPFVGGARYYFQKNAFSPYAAAELGLHFRGFSWEAVNPYTGQKYTGDDSETEFGLGLGGGFLYDMGNMKLDVNAKINIISDQNHITLMAGVLFPLK